MKVQSKKELISPANGDSSQVIGKINTVFPMARKHQRDIIQREKTRHLNVLANTNILSKPGESLIFYINRIGPASLVENRSAWVEFSIWNRVSGVVLEDLFVRVKVRARQSIKDEPGYFEFPVKKMDPGKSIDGAISFLLPRADTDNLVIVELCRLGDPIGEFRPVIVLASDEKKFDVAARFSIHMEDIQIRETAARINDTVVVSFNGQFENTSWADTASLGDQNNTDGIPAQVLPVGPFDVIPNSGKGIAVSCIIANAGHTSNEEDAKEVLLVMSDTGAKFATGIAGGYAILSEGVDELHQAIINWALADCDTVVLYEGRLISEQKLFEYTFDVGDNLSQTPPLAEYMMRCQKKAGTTIAPGFLGGGCRDSDYSTGLSIQRHRVPGAIHDVSIDGIRLSPGQEVSFGRKAFNEKIIFDPLEGPGRMQPDGLYKAPDEITDRKFSIIKWTVYQENKKGIFPAYGDFTVVLLD
jgi:hypothetical protein